MPTVKLFKAVRADCAEAMFVLDTDPVPEGWHKTVAEALAAWVEPAQEPQEAHRPRRGRPPNV